MVLCYINTFIYYIPYLEMVLFGRLADLIERGEVIMIFVVELYIQLY